MVLEVYSGSYPLDDQAVVGRLDIHVWSQFAQLGCEIHVDREIM